MAIASESKKIVENIGVMAPDKAHIVGHSERIALFLPLLVGGGAERVMINLARGLAEKGRKVDLVLGRAEGPLLKLVSEKVRIINLGADRTLFSLPALVLYLRREKPNVLLSALNHGNIICLLSKYLAASSTRSIITLHNTLSEKMKISKSTIKQKIILLAMKIFYPLANEIIAVSSGVSEDYSSIIKNIKNKIKIIYNPVIDKNLYCKSNEILEHPWFNSEYKVIISVGRLTAEKDFSTLISAFSIVTKEISAKLFILGEGHLRFYLEKQVNDLGLHSEVGLPGFVNNPYKYMAKASVFVLSSKTEGLPTALIEALALGTPIISTNCRSGPSEILDNGKFGKLVPVGDVNALAQAIITALRQEKTEVDRAAWQRFEFEWAVNAYLKIIEANHGK